MDLIEEDNILDDFENKTPNQEPGENQKKPEEQRDNEPKAAPKTEPQRVYYRPNDQQQYGQARQESRSVPQGNYQPAQASRGIPTWVKVVLIIAVIFALLTYMMTSCVSSIGKAFDSASESLIDTGSDVTTASATGEYIGVIHVEGTISEDSATAGYNHKYILKSIADMTKDDNNKGIILKINTPGGSVFASDELYFAIKDYQEKTGRPVYSSMQSQATSGGYYISAPCDKIFANRNCWTGSIGVTMGSFYDVSELLNNLGIKVQTITSGRNKAMGSSVEEMTQEQRDILQSLIDEAYDQFTGIVSEGRGMDIKEVRKLADGRIYSALQAKDNGLVDEIATYDETVEAMKKDYALGADIEVLDFWPAEDIDIMSYLGIISEELDKNAYMVTAEEIEKLVDLNGSFRLMYIAE